MSWWQYLLLIFTNFVSIVVTFGIFSWVSARQTKKKMEMIAEHVFEAVKTDIDFQDIMQRNFQKDGENE
jgi:hypothetical protein